MFLFSSAMQKKECGCYGGAKKPAKEEKKEIKIGFCLRVFVILITMVEILVFGGVG